VRSSMMSDGRFRLGAVCSDITAKILTTDFVLNGVHPITGFTNEGLICRRATTVNGSGIGVFAL
jgi:hypothetical protein